MNVLQGVSYREPGLSVLAAAIRLIGESIRLEMQREQGATRSMHTGPSAYAGFHKGLGIKPNPMRRQVVDFACPCTLTGAPGKL